jgi:hypothetical protein
MRFPAIFLGLVKEKYISEIVESTLGIYMRGNHIRIMPIPNLRALCFAAPGVSASGMV